MAAPSTNIFSRQTEERDTGCTSTRGSVRYWNSVPNEIAPIKTQSRTRTKAEKPTATPPQMAGGTMIKGSIRANTGSSGRASLTSLGCIFRFKLVQRRHENLLQRQRLGGDVL